ncbi:MAG: type II toxin-antitoxin system PemK/MazF family toxin [Clostridia bacterium]|nr:type II toxin-antitoxin system PemK/MazF family toxin [Clostridia bacterium]
MEINKNIINIIKRNDEKFKNISFMQDEKLKKEFFTSLKNYEIKLTEQSAYEIALWIESNEKHLSASQQNNFTKYNLGEILLVDLGWNNYDREFAYIHPAIVIKETPTKIFIVPCSSGAPRKDRNGNIYPEFEVGTTADGFQRNTVVMLYEAKYIDKNRVISILGKTSNQFFDKIYNKLFEQIFEPIHYKLRKFEVKQ